MLFYQYEKRGLWVLTTLIILLFVTPRYFREKQILVFWLPEMDLSDSLMNPPPIPAEPIELNRADSSTLVSVRGIGPYYAHKILAYRKRLGGYHSVNQLKELHMTYFNVDSCASAFSADKSLIRKKDLNQMSFKEILQHPYLEYEDVVLIFNAKRKYRAISFDTLQNRKVLPTYKLRKIKPYFR